METVPHPLSARLTGSRDLAHFVTRPAPTPLGVPGMRSLQGPNRRSCAKVVRPAANPTPPPPPPCPSHRWAPLRVPDSFLTLLLHLSRGDVSPPPLPCPVPSRFLEKSPPEHPPQASCPGQGLTGRPARLPGGPISYFACRTRHLPVLHINPNRLGLGRGRGQETPCWTASAPCLKLRKGVGTRSASLRSLIAF